MGSNPVGSTEERQDQVLTIRVEELPRYACVLALGKGAGGAAKMTALLFAIDFVKERTGIANMGDPRTQLHFDSENITTPEEVLLTKMESMLIKRSGIVNPGADKYEAVEDVVDKITLNDKEQLLRTVQVERARGRVLDVQSVLAFDVTKLPQATTHSYVGEPKLMAAGIQRVKVPVKDGHSQSRFIEQAKKRQALAENAGQTYYTLDEVREHSAEDDCWTVYKGVVYDVTEYAKVHPGGRKIFLGKGKDCTELYDKYHPWVNAQYLVGKYQVGVLK